jgi:hypothetical protein
MAKIIIIFIFLLPHLCSAQQDTNAIEHPSNNITQGLVLPEKAITVHAIVHDGDTIPYASLDPIVCYVPRYFTNQKDAVRWTRIKYNVKVVYPYAILAAAKLKEYDLILSKIPNESDKRAFTAQAEKQLKAQFGEELKNLSMTQGRILIKLVYRETGRTTYDVVKEMRGSFSAFMWQSLAFVFSSNLKDDYDAEGDDKDIEEAIRLIENGDF